MRMNIGLDGLREFALGAGRKMLGLRLGLKGGVAAK